MRLCYVLLIKIAICDCAKILAVFNYPSKSHHILGESLLKALAARGHDVTMLSPFKSNNLTKNYTEIVLSEILKNKEDSMSKSMIKSFNSSTSEWDRLVTLIKTFVVARESFFNTSYVKHLLKSDKQYDLAIVTYFGDAAVLALAQRIANYTIAFNTLGFTDGLVKITKVPIPISYIPFWFMGYPDEMSLLQRTITFMIKIIFFFLAENDQIFIDQHFSNPPLLDDVQKNVSLILLNSNPSIESPRPYLPNMIQIGGMHVEESKPLQKDLEDFMNDASAGVIFFSLGSNIKASDIDSMVIEGIISCFSKLPYKVLWKFDKINTTNLPENIKISNWFPQRDILGHKNLKLFITHGGLLSVTESLYHGIPMIGIPIYGDQQTNVVSAAIKGYLVELPFYNLSEESLRNAILKVTQNSRYRENAQKRSRIFKDLPKKPMDTAVYWVEYVLRHNGAFHLQTKAMKLNFYEENMLDVIAVILLALFIIYRLVKTLISLIRRLVCSNKSKLKTL